MRTEEMKHNADVERERRLMSKKVDENEIIHFLNKATKSVLAGNEDAYKVALMLKALETAVNSCKDQIKDMVYDEVFEQPIEFNGFKIEPVQSGRYDYSINTKWTELKEEIKKIETDMQAAAKSKFDMITEDGEIVEPAVFVPYKPSYKITKIK